ncbi:MAG: hypothetical protein NZM26_05310 [Patescibacteria group bacterium]|nr:hypothetical protein [Patescibacteria group bacterium]
MRWQKRGLIYKAPFDGSWRDNSALTPTPILINNDVIRIYVSFRDSKGVGRIGFVDVQADNPTCILRISEKPVLDIGQDGCFDDNGVILGDVLFVGDEIWMYYVGFQLVHKAKFLAFSGLAISHDGGITFKRSQKHPVLDRSGEGLYIRAIHSVQLKNNKFCIWYAAGNTWETIEGQAFPSYHIRYAESENGNLFPNTGILCLNPDAKNLEYRIGRPRVYQRGKEYLMFFTYGTLDKRYLAGAAISKDGIEWQRDDKYLRLPLSSEGWDSVHLCYPSLLSFKNRTYVFYNGNYMGREGFGFAELVEW